MKKENITITKLEADEGFVLTDGQTYGKVFYLAEDRKEEEFSEISENEIPSEEPSLNIGGVE